MKHLQKINHDYLRYANCWEDADVLLNELDITEGDRVLSIGSAGDNCFSLLTGSPELVLAVDVNKVQLALIELKRASIKELEYEEFMELLGFTPSKRRTELFDKASIELSCEVKAYWANNIKLIEAGLIHQGKFEKYFALFRDKVLPLIHRKKKITELLEPKNQHQQTAFYHKKWNTYKWKSLFKLFFSKYVMGRLGRDPEFLSEVGIPVGDFIYEKASNQLTSKSCQSNYFLSFILNGNFQTELPHYARKENFEIIKQNIDRLEIKYGYAQQVAEDYSGLNKFNLSNIFEYMDMDTFTSTSDRLVRSAAKGAKFAYWNLMAPRKMSTVITSLSTEHKTTLVDKGFFYSDFNLNVKL